MTSCRPTGHLVRINSERGRTHGWQARYYPKGRGIKGGTYRSRFFADLRWGGSRSARELAERWLATARTLARN